MPLRVLQAGQGPSRPLVAAFGPMAASKLPALLGERACIVFDPDGHGNEPMPQIVEFAARQGGFAQISATALIGFSVGCSRVRGLRIAGTNAGAYVLVDGTHASKPPQPWQLDWLRDLVAQARAGQILMIASHTYQTYVEKMPKPYLASVTVLRLATGLPLDQGGTATAPVIVKQPLASPPAGGLWVYSYASAEADPDAHAYQGGPALHTMAKAHLAPWLAQVASRGTPDTRPTLLVGDSLAVGLAPPLKTRLGSTGGELVSRGVNSTTIDQWAQGTRLAESLAQAKPGSTLVSLGTNDLAAKPADHKRAWIAAIVDRIRAAGSTVAWILPPSMPIQDRGGTRAILAQELGRLSVPAFPSEAVVLPRGPDGIHPTPAGYDMWAAHLVAWLALLRPSSSAPHGVPGAPPSGPSGPAAPSPSIEPLMVLGALAAVLRA